MTPLEMFDTCRKGGYKKTLLGADWKIENNIMYFQQSRGKTDWLFNCLSALRIPGRLGKTWFLFPFGAWCMWKTLKRTVRKNPVHAYIGYSQGGWFASYASATTARPAFTFGCPKLGRGQAWLFSNTMHRKCPGDIVTLVPPWAATYGRKITIRGDASRPDGMSKIEWLTHHTPEEYRQRLTDE